ncbi:MAG: hypothetical protein KDK53_00565 [Maritimibacter sp.]|nr:hypothetical protein [Maritimibacter sp.]
MTAAETGVRVFALETAPRPYRNGNSRRTRPFRDMHMGALGPLSDSYGADEYRADLTQLADPCHGCWSRYGACKFTRPHELELNLRQALAETGCERAPAALPFRDRARHDTRRHQLRALKGDLAPRA